MSIIPSLHRRRQPAFLLTLLLGWTGAFAPPAPCPRPSETTVPHLYGLWRAEFEGLPQGATLLLEKHRDYAQSVSGEVNRNGDRARLAGDLEDGEFTLEESADGVRITATWLGDVVEGSCGREIRGTWRPGDGAPGRPFRLRKIERW
jgi:hypothetical protein